MACAAPAYLGSTSWFLFVVIISFISTVLWCFAYLLSLREALNIQINWILTVSILLYTCYQISLDTELKNAFWFKNEKELDIKTEKSLNSIGRYKNAKEANIIQCRVIYSLMNLSSQNSELIKLKERFGAYISTPYLI